MSITATAPTVNDIATWPTDSSLTDEQKVAVLDIAQALAVGADPEGVTFTIYDPASHVAPVRLSKPLTVLAGIRVEHDEHHDEHARLLGQDLGELVATVRTVDYVERGQAVEPHEAVSWLIENAHRGVSLPHLAAPDDALVYFSPEGHSLTLDSEALRIVGIGIDSRGGRETIGVPLPSGLEARESVYRLRLTAV